MFRDQARGRLGQNSRPKWDPGRSGSLPKNFFSLITTQMQAVVTLLDNLLPLHPVSPSIKWQ